jgi:hypothetical protein
MKGWEFVIEGTFESVGRGYVVARAVDPSVKFTVLPGSALGGCLVEQWLHMPRALDGEGLQRIDVFGFCLKVLADRMRLKPGDFVLLT